MRVTLCKFAQRWVHAINLNFNFGMGIETNNLNWADSRLLTPVNEHEYIYMHYGQLDQSKIYVEDNTHHSTHFA